MSSLELLSYWKAFSSLPEVPVPSWYHYIWKQGFTIGIVRGHTKSPALTFHSGLYPSSRRLGGIIAFDSWLMSIYVWLQARWVLSFLVIIAMHFHANVWWNLKDSQSSHCISAESPSGLWAVKLINIMLLVVLKKRFSWLPDMVVTVWQSGIPISRHMQIQ